jgi:threonine/homoserine/homoserine lactone efflux protein
MTDIPEFVASSLVVIMTPGPDLALVTRLVLNRRTLAAPTAAAFGMIAAGAGQAALGALGLATLLHARHDLFTGFRWAGAAVLLGWAVLALRSALRPGSGEPSEPPVDGSSGSSADGSSNDEARAWEPRLDRSAFTQGLLCTGSNPKVGLFLMAFLPQFVPQGVNPAGGVAILAACYLAMGLAWLLTWMRLVRRLARHMHSPRTARVAHGVTAAVFSLFALRLALGG